LFTYAGKIYLSWYQNRYGKATGIFIEYTDEIWVILKRVMNRAHGTRQIGKGKGHGAKRKNREKRGIGEAGRRGVNKELKAEGLKAY